MRAWHQAAAPIVLALLTACSKSETPEDAPRTPWRAQPTQAAPSLRARFDVKERCSASVELRAREAKPRGSFRVCRGQLDVDLLSLSATKGQLSIDVASIEMLEDADGGRSDDYTQQAQNWLDVGASRPEAERERLRWATFTLSALEDLSASAAHAGKRIEQPTGSSTQDATPDDAATPSPRSEHRAVSFTARGALQLHGVRVEVTQPMRAIFHYTESATAERVPSGVTLESRRPLAVTLRVFDIKPRDAAGTFLARDMKLLGKQVGTEARVSLALELGAAAR